ncbi:MAG: hypothetical protein M0Q95_10925 [Porticoccaceae bacterium]|nr:hypothetical protein [Porticoccaceae bacterium]
MTILDKIPDGEITLGPNIKINDPIIFNVCLAACAEPTNMKSISRYWLEYIHIDAEHMRITGSNGSMMVSAEAVDFSGWDGPHSLLIRPERPLPAGAKSVVIHKNQPYITGIDGYGRGFSIPYLSAVAQYPDVSPLIDSIHDDNSLLLDRVSFDQRYLMKLLAALNITTCWPVIRPYRINNGNPEAVGYDINFNHLGIDSHYTAIIMAVD